MQFLVTAAFAAALGLTASGLSSTTHEDDPKLLHRVPPRYGRPTRTHVPAGASMSSGGQMLGTGSHRVTLLSQLPLNMFGTPGNGNDCWGYTSPSGREYALFGHEEGTGFVEITDPTNPVIVANMAGPVSLWRDVEVFGTYAYAVSEGGSGVQIFNMANIDNGVVTLANTITTGGSTATHTDFIDTVSGFLYRSGGSTNGLRIYDLNQSPTNPPLVATWSNHYSHEVHVHTYTSGPYAGKQVAFVCGGLNGGQTSTRLAILDVTNKANIVLMSEEYWTNARYSHQCWLSEDQRYIYLNDELDEGASVSTTTTYVFDVQNLSNPVPVGTGSFTNGNSAIGHNLYIRNGLGYAANYRSGLRVWDTNVSINNPPEVAWYDTWPSDDSPQFNGLWGTYPFFPSGVVIGSDLEAGLFVWWVGDPLLDVALVQTAPALINPAGMTIGATVTESTPGIYASNTAQLNYDIGGGVVNVPMVDLGGGNFNVVFPALPCGSTVLWYLSAESTNGLTWTYPAGGASNPLSSTVATSVSDIVVLDMQAAGGWIAGDTGDNATTGIWTRVDPVGTAAQPEDDHTPTTTLCWVTGQGSAGGSVGAADVDGGTTTLKSAVYNLSSYTDPIVGYWRWYSNNQGVVDDTFVVEITGNGSTWVNVESIGPGNPQASGGWYYHEFTVSSFVTPSATVQVRFKASDLGQGSIVEAGIDDFAIRDVDCATMSVYCTAGTSANGCVPAISGSGTASASASSGFTISVANVEGQKTGLIFYGVSGTLANSWGGGSSSYLCVKAPTQRTPAQSSGGTTNACNGALSIDWNAYIANNPTALGAPFSAGQMAWAQAWYRDPASPNTTSLSNGLAFTVGP